MGDSEDSTPGSGASALAVIDELTAANRATRDPAIEQRLVELRVAAFQELDRSPGRPSWPPAVPDPFPGEQGIPRIDAGDVTADVLSGAIVHHGVLRVDGLLDPETVDRFRELTKRSFEERAAAAGGAPLEREATWVPFEAGADKANGFGADGFVRIVDMPRVLFELVESYERTGLLRAITGHLGERPAMIANKWSLRRTPSGKAGHDFHQDGAFLGDGIRTVNCWVALSECGPGTNRPAMDLMPRRYAVLPSGEGATFRWSLAESTVFDALPGVEPASPVMGEGDALLFDECLPHRTTYGPELGERYAIEAWFVAPSAYPDKHLPVVL